MPDIYDIYMHIRYRWFSEGVDPIGYNLAVHLLSQGLSGWGLWRGYA